MTSNSMVEGSIPLAMISLPVAVNTLVFTGNMLDLVILSHKCSVTTHCREELVCSPHVLTVLVIS